MILEILRRTPIWVWPLFVLLVYLGYTQTRTRAVGKARLSILPVLMPCLSIFAMASVFGANATAFACWLAALLAAVSLMLAVGAPRGVTYSPDARSFTVPGSWWPLALIMAIFFTRYTVAVALAMHRSLPQQILFTVGVSITYGLPSGFFIGRALNIWRSAKPAAVAA